MKPLNQLNAPTIQIEATAKAKMFAMAKLCTDKECAAKGIVEKIDTDVYRITDFVLYPQLVTGVTVTDNDEEYVKWLLAQDNADKFKCHMHSHVNMGVSPSGVDWTTWENLIKNTPSSPEEPGYLITIIVNQKQDYTICLYDKEKQFIYETNELNIVEVIDGVPVIDWYKEQEKLYIKKKEYKSITKVADKVSASVKSKKDKGKSKSLFDDSPRRDCPECGGYTIPYGYNGWRECIMCGYTFNEEADYGSK